MAAACIRRQRANGQGDRQSRKNDASGGDEGLHRDFISLGLFGDENLKWWELVAG